jgi:DNA/RNA endonuclease YhcR with UshA esterase domain
MTQTESMNLADDEQLGTPGAAQSISDDDVEMIAAVQVEEADEDETIHVCESSAETTDADEASDETEEDSAFDLQAVEEVDDADDQVSDADDESNIDDSEDSDVVEYAPLIGDVLINEFVSDPTDGVEWIELINTQDVTINVEGWFVQDASGSKTTIYGELTAGGLLVIENPKGNLNNGGDTITLFTANDDLMDTVMYDDATAPEKGESRARDAHGTWQTTETPTYGSTNIITSTEDVYEDEETASSMSEDDSTDESSDVSADSDASTPVESDPAGDDDANVFEIVAVASDGSEDESESTEESTDDVSNDVTNSTTSVTGVVTALPGTFGSQIAYIDSMQLYFYHAEWPELSLGDVVTVTGETSVAREEQRLKISDAQAITVVEQTALEAVVIQGDELNDQKNGAFVEISGSIVSREGGTLTIDSNGTEVEIVAHNNTGVSWSSLTESDVRIQGIVRFTGGSPRVFVRSYDDILPLEAESESGPQCTETTAVVSSASTSGGSSLGGMLLLGGATAALSFWYLRARRRTKLALQ